MKLPRFHWLRNFAPFDGWEEPQRDVRPDDLRDQLRAADPIWQGIIAKIAAEWLTEKRLGAALRFVDEHGYDSAPADPAFWRHGPALLSDYEEWWAPKVRAALFGDDPDLVRPGR